MAKYTSNVRKLRVLMWKLYHLRKYHYIVAAVELLLPILVVYGVSKGAALFLPSPGMQTRSATFPGALTARKIVEAGAFVPCVAYTPSYQPFRNLMCEYREYMESKVAHTYNWFSTTISSQQIYQRIANSYLFQELLMYLFSWSLRKVKSI